MTAKHRVVIVGGGFGGVYAAQALKRADVEITLIDRRNFHLFQPLLYQVATGGLSPANIAAPLRAILRHQKNVTSLQGEVVDFDLGKRKVLLADAQAIEYDTLIVGTGSRHHYFGHPEWEEHAPGLKTIEDATRIRHHVLEAFEFAERSDDPAVIEALLTFVVVGGGPTGVELAGAIGELAHHTLRGEFRRIQPSKTRILLLEAADRILTSYPPHLSAKATQSLHTLGVTVRTGTAVVDVQGKHVTVKVGDRVEVIPTHTVLWGAGVQGSPLAGLLAQKSGAQTDRAGRIMIGPDLTLPGYPEVFAIGDMTCFLHQNAKPLPGVAQVAMQMGKYTADLIKRRLRNSSHPGAFRYRDLGSMATIGRARAVADLGWMTLAGYPAWLAWLFIHLIYLVVFENRVLVLIQWSYNYFTRARAARLITGSEKMEQNSPQ
jgi:NADH dehydrogenase